MRAFISKLKLVPVAPLVVLIGLGMIAWGIAALVSIPAAIIAGGVFLILLAIDSQLDLAKRAET